MEIIEKIKDFVEQECKKTSSKYGYEPFRFHFLPTSEYADKLSDKLGGDKEVILISAWLHDIGSIIYGRENHHITSANIAEEKLKELNYPSEKIEQVKKCISNHRSSQENNRESVEEQILAEADTMAAFDNIAGIFKAAFIYEDKTQSEAKDVVRQKLERKYNQLHFKESKEMIGSKFQAVMLLFGD